MRLPDWLLIFLQYWLLIPALFFCVLPLQGHFRYPLKRLYGLTIALITALCAAATAAGVVLGRWLPANALLPIAAAAYLFCLKLTDVSFFRLLNVFLNAIAVLSFTGFAGVMMESRFKPEGALADVATYGLLTQWALTLLLLFIARPLLKKQYAWLLNAYQEENVWRLSWIVPALIAACVIYMMPKRYSTMWVGRVYSVTLVIIGVLLCLFMIFNLIFYRMAHRSAERAALERRAYLLSLQADQYAKLKTYMDQTAQQRHDFRHSMRMLGELARQGKTDELCRYAEAYSAKLEERGPKSYCANLALNALFNYYAAIAEQNQTSVKLQIALPEKLPVAEVDLCSLMGNLMENAIDACLSLPKERRRLALSAEMTGGHKIYIASTNPFNGDLKPLGDRYRSTKHSGESMGLRSVRAIAEDYEGTMDAHPEGGLFCVNVLLKGKEG